MIDMWEQRFHELAEEAERYAKELVAERRRNARLMAMVSDLKCEVEQLHLTVLRREDELDALETVVECDTDYRMVRSR